MRECSRKRPKIDLTVMFSETPLIPGCTAQIPRINNSIFTPACDASYNFATKCSSKIELSLNSIPAGRPFFAWSISRSIRSVNPERNVRGATSKREYVDWGPKPDN